MRWLFSSPESSTVNDKILENKPIKCARGFAVRFTAGFVVGESIADSNFGCMASLVQPEEYPIGIFRIVPMELC